MKQSTEDWLNWLRVDKSAATVAGYAWEVGALARAAPEKGPLDFGAADLARYLAARRARGASDATIKRAVAAFRSFFRHVCGNASPAQAIPFPRVKRRRQRTLTDDQMLAVLAACDTSAARGTRDLALMCLMVDSGVRAAEVCRLRLADVDLQEQRFVVVVKGGDEREGGFTAATGSYLAAWLDQRGRFLKPSTATLFCSLSGKTKGASLTTDGLRAIFRVIGRRAGLARFSPHDLRRTFATMALRSGAPTRIVQVAGRWEDVRMVERYSQEINQSDLNRYRPIERLLGR